MYLIDFFVNSMYSSVKRNILVYDWGVGRPVLVDNGHHESDEFWPEVQVLYRWTLLLSGNVLLPALWGREWRRWELQDSVSVLRVRRSVLVVSFEKGKLKSCRGSERESQRWMLHKQTHKCIWALFIALKISCICAIFYCPSHLA